jgi:hypothetical protein
MVFGVNEKPAKKCRLYQTKLKSSQKKYPGLFFVRSFGNFGV